jgi:hypothetical protein
MPPFLPDNKGETHAQELSSFISLKNVIEEIGVLEFETLQITLMVMSGSHYSDPSQTSLEEEDEAINNPEGSCSDFSTSQLPSIVENRESNILFFHQYP